MATRRTTTPRKRPVARPVTPALVANEPAEQKIGGGGEAHREDLSDLVNAGLAELLEDFEAILLERPELDPADREALQQLFGEALNDAASSAAAGTLRPVSVEDLRAEANKAIRALREGGVSDDDANQLIRKLHDALQPLEQRETQLTLEFSRRLQSEGEVEALAWLREQTRQTQTVPVPPPPRGDEASPLSSEVVGSRSRRLRGPPRST